MLSLLNTATSHCLTPRKIKRALAVLEQTGSMSDAADAAGCTRQALYDLRTRDPAIDAACREAQERVTDRLERKVLERAENGTSKGVWYKGERVGEEIETHDGLSQFMLKARRPEQYRDDSTLNVSVGVLTADRLNTLSDEELQAVVVRAQQGQQQPQQISNNVNNVKQLSTVYQECTELAHGQSAGPKGPKASRPGGGGIVKGSKGTQSTQYRRASALSKKKPRTKHK